MPSRYELEQRRRATERLKRQKRNIPSQRRFSRRHLLWGVGGVAAAGIVGYGAYEVFSGENADGARGKEFEDVLAVYPEMQNAIVKQLGTITTPQKTINFYNFTDTKLDPEQTRKVYELAEKVRGEDILMQFRVNGMEVPISVQNPVRKLRLFIVNKEEPLPKEAGTILYGFAAYTGILKTDNSIAYTVIRIHQTNEIPRDSSGYYSSGRDFNNAEVFTEACQASARASIYPDPRADIQESFCNSFGRALEFASKGVPFSQYRQQAKERKGYIEGVSVPIAPFSESFYNKIPVLGPFK